jgi:hypothetical protein
MILGDDEQTPEFFGGVYISANAFRLLGEQPLLGRDFRAEDDRAGAQAVVILGHSIWMSRYGADPAVVGQTVRVNHVPSTVVGVMPEAFGFPLAHEIWQPLALAPNLDTERRDTRGMRAFGRLAEGVTTAEAQAELNTIVERLAREHPETNKELRPIVGPYTGTANQPIFLALFGAVGFVTPYRLRERGQPAAFAGGGTLPRNLDSNFAWRRPVEARATAPHREPRARASRRHRRVRDRGGGRQALRPER